MRIIKLTNSNSSLLEDELDRIAEKHGIEPRLRTMPLPSIFDQEVGFDWRGNEEDYDDDS